MKQKLKYLLRSAVNMGQQKKCPFCGGTHLRTVDRKFFVTSLLLCEDCRLKHRHPKDDEEKLRQFYQIEYSVDNLMMTELPSDEELEELRENNFPSLRSFDAYINSLFDRKVKIIDYGCSWGYNVYKLLQSGHEATGFEISVPRAKFGRQKLGVEIFTNEELLPPENDIILSSHVIEHLSNIREFISQSKKLLKEGGLFIAFCPNGSEEYRKRESWTWHVNWGSVHPNYLDVEFAKQAFRNNPYLILTGDWYFNLYDLLTWDGESQVVGSSSSGKELLIIAKPNIFIQNPSVVLQPSVEKTSEMLERIFERASGVFAPSVA